MSQELRAATMQGNEQMFQKNQNLPAAVNTGSVTIEIERAIAEAQGQLIIARKFPRDLNQSRQELMESCAVWEFASKAFYSVPNRGSGPSIRFAEEVARVYGHFQYGHRELSREKDRSEVEVYAWDMQKNNYSKRQITVMHVTDTKAGPKVLRDQADIDNKIANVASKQMRGRILALMPKWLVEEAIEACKKTLAGEGKEPLSIRVRKIADFFNGNYGVTVKQLEEYIGKKLEDVTMDDYANLYGVFNAIREGAKIADYFVQAESKQQTSMERLKETAAAPKPKPKAAPAPKPEPEELPEYEEEDEDPDPSLYQESEPEEEEEYEEDPAPVKTKNVSTEQAAARSNRSEPRKRGNMGME